MRIYEDYLYKKFEDNFFQRSNQPTPMCDNCKSPPYSFRGTRHEQVACPFKTSQYCSWCAIYGHTMTTCPAPPSTFYTEPCYVEQLIPSSLLKQYNITTQTLLPTVKPPVESTRGFLEIKDDDKVIRAFLVARGQIGPRTENSTMIRDALMKYAKAENKRLIYISKE